MSEWNIINSAGSVVATAKKVEYHGKLMDERYVTVDIDSPVRLDLTAGDYMIYRGDKFTLRDSSEIEKCARPQSYGGAFIYKDLKLVAQSWQELYDTEMTDYVYHDNDMHYTGLGTFSFYMTKVSDMGYRVQAVMDNKYGAGKWVVMIGGVALTDNYSDVEVDDAKSISISSGTSVKDTLNMLWTEWGYYYKVSSSIVNNELVHYVDLCPGTGTTLPLYYGKKRTEVVAGQSKEVGGLVKIVRKINPNVEICTRVRAYGSERNLPYHWYNNKYGDQTNLYDPLRSMYIPQLMLPHIALYYDEDGNYCDADGDLYEQGDDAVVNPNDPIYPWSSPNDVVLENVVTSALFGKRDKEVHWNSEDMGEIFPSMKGMKASDVTGLQTKTYGNQGSLDRILSFSYGSSGDTGSSLPADVTSDKMNFIVYVPNPGFNPTDHNTSDNVELLVQSGMCQARAFTIIKSEGCDTNGEPVTDGTGTVVQYKLTCAKIIDEEIDQVFPNSPYFEIGAGDYYVYTGLEFNGDYSQDTWLDVYVRAAEMRLLRAAALWLREHSREDYIHEVSIDNLYMKTMPNISANLVEGASVKITDNNIGSNKTDIVESVTITEGKEAIPTYDVTFLRRDESESLGDRVKGLVGQSISASSELAKANDSLAKKVNVANLMELLTPLAADGTTAIAWNQATLQNTHYLRANVDFFGVSGVSALGRSSGGGGGGGSADLNALLDSINDSSIGNTLPTLSENGKCPVWIQTTENNGHWEWGTTGGEGGGVILREPLSSINSALLGTPTESGQVITWNGSQWIYAIPQGGGGTGTVTSITAGTGLSGGTITTAGTISISSTYLTQIGEGHTAYGWGNHATAGYQPAINDLATIRNNASNGATAYGWGNHASAGYATDSGVVHKAGAETITGEKTFTANLFASNGIYLNKTTGSDLQQWVNFDNQKKNFGFGQESGGDCVLYSGVPDDGKKVVNFYTNINGNPYTLFIQGSTGNVGIGKNNPTYKFDVSGNIHTDSAYYLDGRLFANNDTNNNTGLHIGYEYAVDDSENPSPLPTTLWGDGISFRSAGGTYGGCTKIDDTHGNITYGIMATDFIGVTNKFRFEYDLRNNTVWVLKADGTAVNFASLGGVTSLGVGSSGTPNISSMNIATLTTTNTTVGNQLHIGTSGTNNGQINFYDADETGGASISVNSGDLHITSDSTTYIDSLLSVDGEVRGTSLHTSGGNLTMDGGKILMGGGRIYLDATRYLYLNGSSLMYYNGTSSINVA